MPKSKKKFIDKKSAVTFHLVHRSQHDPLVTDETAPQHVLVQSDAAPTKQQTAPSSSSEPKDPEKRKKELKTFGIFFDDDYDYLQHLRGPEENAVHWEYVEPTNLKGQQAVHTNAEDAAKAAGGLGGLVLPSSVFASEFEEDEGMLRKAAPRAGPRLDWDPDIVAALDDDFDHENPDNQLDDDFMEQAIGGEGMDDIDEEGDDEDRDLDSDDLSDDSEYSGAEERDALGPLRMYNDEECKSRFTEYSMSSSVIRRNEQLQLLDERFEKFFEKYDEPEIGALDCEEIEGHVELGEDLLNQCMVEFKRDEDLEVYKKEWDVERIRKLNAGEDDEEDEVLMEVQGEKERPFDCETILSTYSNIYNHPKLIEEPSKRRLSKIQINPKTGLPENVLHGDNKQLTTKALAKLDAENRGALTGGLGPKSLCAESVMSTLSVLSIRPKDESTEEKHERKTLLKSYRRERRIERKANTQAFKDEKKEQERIHINNRRNIQGKSIV